MEHLTAELARIAPPPEVSEEVARILKSQGRVDAVKRAMQDVRAALERNIVTACWHEQHHGESGRLHGCIVVKTKDGSDQLVWLDMSLSAD